MMIIDFKLKYRSYISSLFELLIGVGLPMYLVASMLNGVQKYKTPDDGGPKFNCDKWNSSSSPMPEAEC